MSRSSRQAGRKRALRSCFCLLPLCSLRPLWFLPFLFLLDAQPAPAATSMPASAPRPKAHVMILDFASEGELGKAVAQNVRMRLARHAEYFVLDRISTQDLSPAVGAEADANEVLRLLNRAGCDVAFWGTVRRNGGGVAADVRCASASGAASALAWRK